MAHAHAVSHTHTQVGDVSLDVGLERMAAFRANEAELTKSKDELSNAQVHKGLSAPFCPPNCKASSSAQLQGPPPFQLGNVLFSA